jgi:hypothetical protein
MKQKQLPGIVVTPGIESRRSLLLCKITASKIQGSKFDVVLGRQMQQLCGLRRDGAAGCRSLRRNNSAAI